MSMKMVVIPYEKYKKLTKENNPIPSVDKDNMSTEFMNNNPSKQEEFLNIDSISDNKSQSIDMLNEEDILDYIPKTNKNKCKLIMKHMKNNHMNWNSKGQLLLDEECIENTHIVDLLKDITSVNKKSQQNINSLHLNQLLANTHCPKSVLSKSLFKNGKT